MKTDRKSMPLDYAHPNINKCKQMKCGCLFFGTDLRTKLSNLTGSIQGVFGKLHTFNVFEDPLFILQKT